MYVLHRYLGPFGPVAQAEAHVAQFGVPQLVAHGLEGSLRPLMLLGCSFGTDPEASM